MTNRHYKPLCLVLALLLVVSRARAGEDSSKPAEIFDQKTADHGFTVWAASKSDFPLTVLVDFPQMENFSSSARTPISVLIQPHKRVMLTRLSRINARRPAQYNTEWTFFWGWRSDKPLEDFLYTLPFKEGFAYRIAQGFNGQFSHQGINALDFAMPQGSTICAARAGTVIEVVQSNTEGGTTPDMKPKANRIIILHEDGTTSTYAHLKYDGSLVNVGQRVRAGDEIGLSGATGYASGPHLHFEVDRPPAGKFVLAYESIAEHFSAAAADGTVITMTPKEHELVMRPFPPRDAPLHKFPANAIEQLTTSRRIDGAKPVDVTEAFAVDQPIIVSMHINMFGHEPLKLTVTSDSAPPTDPAICESDLATSDQQAVGVVIEPAKIEHLRGNCTIHITCDGHDLATAPVRVGN